LNSICEKIENGFPDGKRLNRSCVVTHNNNSAKQIFSHFNINSHTSICC